MKRLTLGLALVLRAAAAQATTITVNTTVDDFTNNGNCSLREALEAANTNAARDACPAGSASVRDLISIPAGVYLLGGGQALNPDDVVLQGAGASLTIIDGGATRFAFTRGILYLSSAEVNDLTL